MEEMEGQNVFILRCDLSGRKDPRQVVEHQIASLSEKLNPRPTLPSEYQHLCNMREAYDLPSWHCSFRGCSYASETEKELADHISSSHAAAFAEVCSGAIKAEDMLGMYAAAITWQCQSAAPVANVSVDRRALRAYQKSLEADNISCLLCFVCARKYPYVRSSRNQDITWVQPVDAKNETIFGQSVTAAEELLGMQTFRQKYVEKETEFAREEMNAELEAWACQVDFTAVSVQLLCCPEDKTCQRRCRPRTLCSQCWVPLCKSCRVDLVWQSKQPAAALSNDMMIYYGPREAYSMEVTVMEMLCASPCLTTMICFSLEQKSRGDRALDQDVWMNRQRMAVRGNATTFPLAWEDLLQQLQDLEKKAVQKTAGLKLPHCGAKLREVVNVIVKSHQGTKESMWVASCTKHACAELWLCV